MIEGLREIPRLRVVVAYRAVEQMTKEIRSKNVMQKRKGVYFKCMMIMDLECSNARRDKSIACFYIFI